MQSELEGPGAIIPFNESITWDRRLLSLSMNQARSVGADQLGKMASEDGQK